MTKVHIEFLVVIVAILLAIIILVVSLAIGYYHVTRLTDTTEQPIEIADTAEARQAGLSGRQHGQMLFIFPRKQIQCMWAKDMKFPVIVRYLDDLGEMIGSAKLPAGSVIPRCSSEPVRYVLETEAK